MATTPWRLIQPPIRPRSRAKPLLTVLLAALIISTAMSTAWAAWTARAVAGGNGAAAATTVEQGATPAASVVAQSVTVSWAASTLSTGDAVDGYVVARYDAISGAPQSILSDCEGVIAATTCTESSVPEGAWTYAVTPVLAANWQGAESPKSSDVTVGAADSTPPANVITATDAAGVAALSGTTVHYRGVEPGSFTLTNALTDADSGPASSATATLGGDATGWAHTPSVVSTPSGGPYVSNAFEWASGTTSSPSQNVTGSDVAGNTATTALSFVDDSTAPSAGTITYDNGYTPGRFVTVTFTTGTDDGSGIATRRLQRAQALLTDGACGTFGTFTNRGPADLTSPYTDSAVANGNCYRYRYVVTDRVSNQHIATSANTAKVDYAGAVAATTGALSHWRLGETGSSPSTLDSFTGTSGDTVSSRSGEVGATWTYRFGNTTVLSDAGRARRQGNGYSIYHASGTPASADYAVEADFHHRGALTGDALGIIGRFDTASTTFYMARYEQQWESWTIYKYVNGAGSYFDGWVGDQPLTVGQTYRVRLEISGSSTTTIKMYVNGVQMGATATDTSSPITAAGRAGFWDGVVSGSAVKSDTVGLHLDNFQVTPADYPLATDRLGPNTGRYVNGPTLGAPGALGGDADTAAAFDGVNDYVQAVGTTGIPTGAGLRSVEAWFKTSSSARQVLFSYGAPADSQEFGLWLDAGGGSMTAWGFGAGHDKTFTLSAAVNDGAWHHVVKTYDGTSLTVYVDGVALPSQAATRDTVMDAWGFGIGAVVRAGDPNSGGFFAGAIDEVSFYTSVLESTTVINHYELGAGPTGDITGPTGGSVEATGLVGTGDRYSTSVSLSIALDAGTDPAGVAAEGAELRRASATLTSADGAADGVCGAFGADALVATDPVSPRADLVTDQACYRYSYIVADTLGNTATYTSSDIKVDTSAPAAPGLSFAGFDSAYWSGAGTTVYYRSTADSGSFAATASATDTASGIAAYTFPALGTNWTSTPGAGGTNTYSWSPSPAAPGTVGVSATNNATLISSTGSFTLTDDTTAPSVGTVSYPDGEQTSAEVSVSFTTGADSESGIGTRLLQRAAAPLTDGVCGTYDAFATVTDGTDPTSPHTDTVTAGNCYTYQYIVTDNVGNQHVASSSGVVKVQSTSYSESVLATTGLLNYYRLGDTALSSDTFTGTAGATLQSRAGEVGATWTKHASSTGDFVLTDAGRARKNGTTSGAVSYASAVPASADYTVEADIHVQSWVADDTAGVVGRLDPSNALGTYYVVRREGQWGDWVLYARVNGSWSWLASHYEPLSVGSTYKLELEMIGSAIKVRIDGVQRMSVTSTAITGAGRGGVFSGFPSSGTPTVTDTTGMHLDNFRVTPPPVLDSKGTNHGAFFGGATLGAAGALTSDADTAAQFDGVDDHATVAREISADFTIEFWFSSAQGIGTDPRWTQGAGLVDANITGSNNDFGVSLRSDGRVVAGVGGGANGDTSIVSTSGGYNDGSWHHVAFTRTQSSGAFSLYVDGVPSGTATNNTNLLTAQAQLSFGRLASGGNFYAGALDEIAIYSTALSGATIEAHYAAR